MMSTVVFPTLSSEEIATATRYLYSTRDKLIDAVRDLSDPQWNFKPSPDCWSTAEILEHVVLIEDRVHAVIGQMPNAPSADLDRASWQVEEIILTQVPQRSTRIQAPPHVLPTHRWTPSETLARFLESRTRTLQLLAEAPALRGHVIPHPVLGPWDGYQWLLAAAAHSSRHTGQINELKASSGFPATNPASVT
jgi:hypothetical protein